MGCIVYGGVEYPHRRRVIRVRVVRGNDGRAAMAGIVPLRNDATAGRRHLRQVKRQVKYQKRTSSFIILGLFPFTRLATMSIEKLR